MTPKAGRHVVPAFVDSYVVERATIHRNVLLLSPSLFSSHHCRSQNGAHDENIALSILFAGNLFFREKLIFQDNGRYSSEISPSFDRSKAEEEKQPREGGNKKFPLYEIISTIPGGGRKMRFFRRGVSRDSNFGRSRLVT